MRLAQAWYSQALWLHALQPVAWIFRLISSVRRRIQTARQQRPAVPVIVVGNISVGGTGKTPVVIALADALEKRGLRTGVISRGYGGRARQYPLVVTDETDVRHSGDEARLMRHHLRGPLVLDPDRPQALNALLSQQPCDVIVSDDGLQHYRLWRDIEIAVVDGARGLGNGLCLPAGPLREPPDRLRQVDYILVNGDRIPVLPADAAPAQTFVLAPQQWVNVKTGQKVSLASFRLLHECEPGSHVGAHAVAGIGNPDRFFALLGQLGFRTKNHEFGDHHVYQPADLGFAADSRTLLLMTEKDAVKCQRFAADNWWYLQVSAVLPEPVIADIIRQIAHIQTARGDTAN